MGRVKLNPFSSDQLSSLLMGEAGKPKKIGAKDVELDYKRGDLPISEAEYRIDRIREKTGKAKDAVLGGFWDAVKGGAQTIYDVYNYGPRGLPKDVKMQRAAEAKAELDAIKNDENLQIAYEKAKASRRDIRTVRAELAQIIAAAQKREDNEPGSINQGELEARLMAYAKQNGYTAQEIQGGPDVDVDLMPDPYGLTTDQPNPFPEAENLSKFGLGITGNIMGYKMSQHWAIAQPSMMGTGAKAFGTGLKAGMKFWKGGPYWGRILGALGGGLVGVLTADYGYETALDIANQAGAFGEKGINRPGLAPRVRGILNTAELETKLTLGTGYLAPGLNQVRNLTRAGLGAGKVEMEGAELGAKLSEKFIKPGTYGQWSKKEGVWEPIVGITDISRWRFIQGIPQLLGRFPFLGGGIQKNLAQRAEKLNIILNNMTDRIAPSVSYHALSEAVVASSKVTTGKLAKELAKLRGEWFKHAQARGANVKLSGSGAIDDTSPHAIIADFKAYMSNIKGKGVDGAPLPAPVRNRLDTFFDNILKEPGSVTLTRADEMLAELGQVMRMGGMKSNATAVNFAEKFSQSIQNSVRKVDLGEAGQAALTRYDDLWTEGRLLMESPVASKLGLSENMLYGYQFELMNKGVKYADDILNTAKILESPMAMKHAHQLVGPDIFRGMMRRHIVNAYDSALTTWPGKSFMDMNVADLAGPFAFKARNLKNLRAGETAFGASAGPTGGAASRAVTGGQAAAKAIDPIKFIKNLGLDKQNDRLWKTIEEGLELSQKGTPGAGVPKWAMNSADELIDAGARAETIKVLGNTTKVIKNPGFVTGNDLREFADILQSSFRGGIPDISLFIARRAQISGLRGALRAFMPGLGVTKAGGYGAAAGGVLPGVSMLHGIAFSLIARQGGKSLTNPVNLNAFKQILRATDEDVASLFKPWTYGKFGTAPKSLALKNALQTIGYNFNGDLEELELSLADVENQQRRRTKFANVRSEVDKLAGEGEKNLEEQQQNIFEKMKQAREDQATAIPEESLTPPVTGAGETAPTSPMSVDTAAGNTFGGGATGSSIAQNQTMNPSAAASLYAGNTDAALANQFGAPTTPVQQMPRMAARGGIISLVS
jgi:hypothetical protein